MDPKPFWHSKTMWINALTVLVAILLLVADEPILAPEAKTYLILAIGIANIILRAITKQPVTLKRD